METTMCNFCGQRIPENDSIKFMRWLQLNKWRPSYTMENVWIKDIGNATQQLPDKQLYNIFDKINTATP